MFAYLDLWIYDGTLDRVHHALYEACREQADREASPTSTGRIRQSPSEIAPTAQASAGKQASTIASPASIPYPGIEPLARWLSFVPGVFVFQSHLQPLVAEHGYWVVFVIVMLESAGIPLPGETVLILASGYAGATGQLGLFLVIACAATGAITGDNIGFWVGRTWGTKFLLHYGKIIHLPESRLKLGQYLFEKHGAKIVFFGRFVAFLRVFAALLAGVNKYQWPQFLFFNAAGGITWALVFGIGGFFFGDSLRRVSGPLGAIALGGVIVGIIAFTYIVRREEKKMEDKLSRGDVDLRTLP